MDPVGILLNSLSTHRPYRSRYFLPELHLTKYKAFNCRDKTLRAPSWCQILEAPSERPWMSLLLIYTSVIMEMS